MCKVERGMVSLAGMFRAVYCGICFSTVGYLHLLL